ncbi:hypothetical protein Acy02nite_88620 [Actinoplanes cyaneus]|uniref:Tetratricopeptide repeat protein n=1 Tax=Actinoplanes cyaneus TaxID=52696 RepID=A0A919ITH6_9ACTN|nr:hypothetical protein Acy02nite_88620 [Actinoplanes cyaneus]
MFETARAVLPDWWLLHPADASGVRAFAQAPAPRTVAWLDELQRYLDQSGGLPAGLIRDLLAAGTVVLATLWPDEVSVRSAPRDAGTDDRYAEDRELLKLARIIDVPAVFSREERSRAGQLAADGRIRTALEYADSGVTQVLAAGPELIRRWQHAPAKECYGQAVITAALDARRVGAQAPATVDYLTAAAPAYLTPAQQATATPDWFEKAIRYATQTVHGAASCLIPVPAGMGQIAGYLTADYLHESARTLRRTEAVPGLAWQALVTHHHPDDCLRLADNAERRDQIDHAITLYRKQPDAGDGFAAVRLAELLARQGQVQEALTVLRPRADASNRPTAKRRLAKLLAEQGQVQELRQRANAGDLFAVGQLDQLLAEQGQVQELRQRADAGDRFAAERLAGLLAGQGQVQEALTMLRQLVDAGDASAARQLADLLARHGQVQELRQRADAGDGLAAGRLARLLARQGQVDEALTVLRQLVDAGDESAARQLASLLTRQGQVPEAIIMLRQRVDAGDGLAAGQLAALLAGQGQVQEALTVLRQRVDVGDRLAAGLLAALLAGQGQVQELRQRADAGDGLAAERLAGLLAGQGQVQEALTVLRQLLDASGGFATRRLVDLLAKLGRIDDLEGEVRAGTYGAAAQLAQMRGPAGNAEAAKPT